MLHELNACHLGATAEPKWEIGLRRRGHMNTWNPIGLCNAWRLQFPTIKKF